MGVTKCFWWMILMRILTAEPVDADEVILAVQNTEMGS